MVSRVTNMTINLCAVDHNERKKGHAHSLSYEVSLGTVLKGLEYSRFQKKIYKVSVFWIYILRFPLILAGRWNMGDMKVETL